ncbi:hypothetical protein JCM11491_002352 [Sporobolomyces phaffii]
MSSSSTSMSIWPGPDSVAKLSRDDAVAYLERIHLDAAAVWDAQPSLELLRTLQSAHLVAVPFESTAVHVQNWHADHAELDLGHGETVPLADAGFRHLVHLRRGGYCFLLNGAYPALLRALGFNVSECLARVNMIRKDPATHRVDWEALSHQVSIVDWQGSGARYLSDVGFGTGTAFPIPMRDGSEVASIPSTDVYRLSQHDSLPHVPTSLLPDQAPTWMLSRRVFADDSTPTAPKFVYIPQYAFQLLSASHRDVRAMNHYQSTCRDATFYNLFVATLLHLNGERTTLSYHEGSVDDTGRRAAKLTRTRLTSEHRNDEVLETRYVPTTIAAVREVLEREFGMLFPHDYPGN